MVNIPPIKHTNHCCGPFYNLNHNIMIIYHESLRWRSLCDWTNWLYDDCTFIATGWWYTYPSEKYEFVSWDDEIPNIWKNNPNVPNHQPGCDWLIWQTCYFCTENIRKPWKGTESDETKDDVGYHSLMTILCSSEMSHFHWFPIGRSPSWKNW